MGPTCLVPPPDSRRRPARCRLVSDPPAAEPLPLRHHGVLRVLGRGDPAVEDAEPGADGAGEQRGAGERRERSGCAGRPARRPPRRRSAPARPAAAGPRLPTGEGSLSSPSRLSTRCDRTAPGPRRPPPCRRAGPACAGGAAISPTPAPLASALPAKTIGSSGYASCHDGTAVSASSTPVYVASAGAVTAATSPAACPTGGSRPAGRARARRAPAATARPRRPRRPRRPARRR